MKDSVDLDALDRECALAQGWRVSPVLGWVSPDGKDHGDNPPSPTRNPADFLALLQWCVGQDLYPSVHLSRRGNEWEGALRVKGGRKAVTKERAHSPLVAFSLAVAEHVKRKKGAK